MTLTATCKINLSLMASCTKTDFLCTLIIIKASRTVQMVNSSPVQFFFSFYLLCVDCCVQETLRYGRWNGQVMHELLYFIGIF